MGAQASGLVMGTGADRFYVGQTFLSVPLMNWCRQECLLYRFYVGQTFLSVLLMNGCRQECLHYRSYVGQAFLSVLLMNRCRQECLHYRDPAPLQDRHPCLSCSAMPEERSARAFCHA